MAHNHNRGQLLNPPDNRLLQTQPTSADDASEEAADVDEPPDNQNTPRPSSHFSKAIASSIPTKLSALTKMLLSEDNDSLDEDDDTSSPTSQRIFSTTSTWSNPSLTSDGLTSPETRTNTPSPPPTTTLTTPAIAFNQQLFGPQTLVIKHHTDSVDPLQKEAGSDTTATAFEAEFKRKRCIAFACGKKATPNAETAKDQKSELQAKEPPKRKCMLTFACPGKESSKAAYSATRKPSIARKPSPAPSALRTSSPSQRRSSSTSTSTQSVVPRQPRKSSSLTRSRRLSTAGENDTLETDHALEYGQLQADDDTWMKERTCHRSRLTVDDTLKVELDLRKLGKEAEEEEAMEDEAELDNEGLESDDVEDVDEEEDDMDDEEVEEEEGAPRLTVTGDDDTSDDGFHSDDEGGMASSDDDSDAGSDYHWWAPGRSTAATSYEQLDHMHFSRQRNMSGSSIGSISSTKAISGDGPQVLMEKRFKKQRSIPIRPRESDLPDSTDFVCGTLDEDRPMEESYRREIEKRRAAKHRVCPQDIDPSFPTSDPEMDEEDDEDILPNHHEDESDVHVNGVFGNFEPDDTASHHDHRGRTRYGRSPIPSPPKRLHSPPPKRVTVHRSPPPRRLFGQSPKRLCSPSPAARLRSPPPTRRQSFAKSPKSKHIVLPSIALAERPQGQHAYYSTSLPRKPNLMHHYRAPSTIPDAENDSGDDIPRTTLHARGAIDIVKGLEKKKQLRREKLYQKYCRERANGNVKPKEEKRPVPGKGAEKMRCMGLELSGRWKAEKKYQHAGMTSNHDAQHILSL